MRKLNIGHYPQIQRLAEQGWSFNQVAARMDVSPQELRAWRKRYDPEELISFRALRQRRTDPKIRRIAGFPVPY